MRALMLEDPGTPPQLMVVDLPVPQPGPGEALVRVAACGFCHHDLQVMNGTLRRGVAPGVVLGHEISGVVEEVGEGVDLVSPGDRVVSLLTNACGQCDRCRSGREHRCRDGEGIGHWRNGGFAEYVALSQHSLVPLPVAVDLPTASLLACPAGVALQALNAVNVSAGETVVVTGAGGGLGVHAVQLAAALGARTLAVTSTSGKATVLYRYGADDVIEMNAPDSGLEFSGVVMAVTGDLGADVVIDTVGTPTLRSSVRCLGQYGRLAVLGEVGGEGSLRGIIPEIIFRDARITGVSGVSRQTLEQVIALAADGSLTPVLQRLMVLEEAAHAAELLSERTILGRVALVPQAG
ncbi:Acryloyl-coenzyme A reductase [Geodia barretti]|uniref:Acryloyl-coenzyme A reductase n=1 Tax=Geodia barretti TaxID=519541 RepID=A0AA35W278_GEOBA|nr:Acryloyl-coenzyme A reductase [Geodia barretti]